MTRTILPGGQGGTGVDNTGKILTLGGNLSTTGSSQANFNITGITDVTFPTSGTLATTDTPEIASLMVHWDASRTFVGITDTLIDLTGHNNNANSSGSDSPDCRANLLNDNNALSFNQNIMLADIAPLLSRTTDYTIIAIFKANDVTNSPIFTSNVNSNNRMYLGIQDGNLISANYDGSAYVSKSTPFTDITQPHVVAMTNIVSGDNVTQHLDGVLSSDSTDPSTAAFVVFPALGADLDGARFPGIIAEILIWDVVLSPTQLTSEYNRLGVKWGIGLNIERNKIYFSAQGSDTKGSGTESYPYATPSYAMSIAAPLATAENPYVIVGSGIVIDDNFISLYPNVAIQGDGTKTTVITAGLYDPVELAGDWTTGALNLSNLTLIPSSGMNLDFSGYSTGGAQINLNNVVIDRKLTLTGRVVSGANTDAINTSNNTILKYGSVISGMQDTSTFNSTTFLSNAGDIPTFGTVTGSDTGYALNGCLIPNSYKILAQDSTTFNWTLNGTKTDSNVELNQSTSGNINFNAYASPTLGAINCTGANSVVVVDVVSYPGSIDANGSIIVRATSSQAIGTGNAGIIYALNWGNDTTGNGTILNPFFSPSVAATFAYNAFAPNITNQITVIFSGSTIEGGGDLPLYPFVNYRGLGVGAYMTISGGLTIAGNWDVIDAACAVVDCILAPNAINVSWSGFDPSYNSKFSMINSRFDGSGASAPVFIGRDTTSTTGVPDILEIINSQDISQSFMLYGINLQAQNNVGNSANFTINDGGYTGMSFSSVINNCPGFSAISFIANSGSTMNPIISATPNPGITADGAINGKVDADSWDNPVTTGGANINLSTSASGINAAYPFPENWTATNESVQAQFVGIDAALGMRAFIIFNETLTGDIDDSNVVFTTVFTPLSNTEQIFWNGVAVPRDPTYYSISSNVVTFTNAPTTTPTPTILTINYNY